AYLEKGVEMGNFGEVKNARLRSGTKMHHFSYVGDADIGARVNIGAGTITLNYDGVRKNRTIVGEDAFIGSDTLLRAPVTVGAGATGQRSTAYLAALQVIEFLIVFAYAGIAAAFIAPRLSEVLQFFFGSSAPSLVGAAAVAVTVAVLSVIAILLGFFVPRAIG